MSKWVISKISIQSSIQVVDLVDKNFSYKFCYLYILPISIIEGAEFVWILLGPSNNQVRQILYITKNVAKIAYYKGHYTKARFGQIFRSQTFTRGGGWLVQREILKTKNLSESCFWIVDFVVSNFWIILGHIQNLPILIILRGLWNSNECCPFNNEDR